MELKEISRENSFYSKKDKFSLSDYKLCLEKFGANFNLEMTLETKSSIFLDTNILLRYYSISFTARQKLFDFIRKYSDRIILTSQVQFEFLRNREDIIQRFFEQVTNKIPRDFNADIVNKLKNFLDQHKTVLKDYPFVETGIMQHQSDLEELLHKLNETVEKKRKEHTDLIVKDEFLELLVKCNLNDALTPKEIEVIRMEFDLLAKSLTTENVDSFLNKPNSAFPGAGDIKNKPEDPYGDYIIFHEIMKYMINNSKDAIFLTFDNSKGDWFNKNKAPHLHYVLNIYANTGQLLYIIDAERTLGDLLNINIDSLVSETNEQSKIPITIESLTNLIQGQKSFLDAPIITLPDEIITELKVNGYNWINEVERDLDRACDAVKEYRLKENPSLNRLGMLRASLRLANPTITSTVKSDGTISPLSQNFLDRYKQYRYLVK